MLPELQEIPELTWCYNRNTRRGSMELYHIQLSVLSHCLHVSLFTLCYYDLSTEWPVGSEPWKCLPLFVFYTLEYIVFGLNVCACYTPCNTISEL